MFITGWMTLVSLIEDVVCCGVLWCVVLSCAALYCVVL
jgi:hypothetical protein